MAALSMVQMLEQFYAVWFVAGIAMAGALYEPCFALVTRARGAQAKAPITAITLIAGFAGSLSFPLANLGAEAFGWRTTVFVGAAITAFVVAPLNWVGARSLLANVVPAPPKTGGLSKSLIGQPAFWLLAIGFACVALVHGSTLHHLLPYLAKLKVPDNFAITIAALFGPMQVVGRILMVLAGRMVSTHLVALAAFGLIGTSVAILMVGQGQNVSLLTFVLFYGGAYGNISILRPVLAREILGGDGFGTKSGALALPYLVGSASVPFLGAFVWGIGGYGLMLSLSVTLSAVGALLYLAAHRMRAATP